VVGSHLDGKYQMIAAKGCRTLEEAKAGSSSKHQLARGAGLVLTPVGHRPPLPVFFPPPVPLPPDPLLFETPPDEQAAIENPEITTAASWADQPPLLLFFADVVGIESI
jgi:hypothetical protein